MEQNLMETGSGAPITEVSRLCKRFGRVTALDSLSFRVCRGEILGILGPNGAGKTTAIHCMLGLVTPSGGFIRIMGLDIARHRRQILQRVNFSSAYTALPANLTVCENLTVFARLYGRKDAGEKIAGLLELFEIEETADRLTGSLSSGQQTRLNLCKAFLNDPEILLHAGGRGDVRQSHFPGKGTDRHAGPPRRDHCAVEKPFPGGSFHRHRQERPPLRSGRRPGG
jgi:ABC-type branched-subunit amino acid transport system ATPase component